MKLVVKKENLDRSIDYVLTRNGYIQIHDRERDVSSFSMPLGRDRYPRLHLYLNENSSEIILDLHIDQKQASYEGSRMHNAEYDGEVVRAEIYRLQKILGGTVGSSSSNQTEIDDTQTPVQTKDGLIDVGEGAEKKLGKGALDLEGEDTFKYSKPWWRFW